MRIEATLANLLASTTKTKRLLVLFVPLGLALFFVSSMVAALPAQAGTFITVNTTEDESTADGDCSLREAIIAANTDAPRDACPAGSSSVGLDTIGFDLGSSPTITLGSTLPDITDGLVIDGEAEGADVSVSGNDQVRPFIVIRLLYLQNLTITRGNADNADRFGGSGGAIYIANGQLYLNNVTISESNAQGRGGGIAAPSFGTLRVADSTFSGNHADSHGGAIYYNYVLLEVTTSTFTKNSADLGGAIYGKNARVLNSTFAHNGASRGSAIFGEHVYDVMTSTFFNNDQYCGSEGPDASIHGVSLAYTLISERDVEACGFGVEDRSYNIENGDS